MTKKLEPSDEFLQMMKNMPNLYEEEGKRYSARIRSLIRRDGEYCQCCGSTDDLQADHIIPKSWGGINWMMNLQLLCGKCNRDKSNHHATDYRGSLDVS